MIKAGPMSYMIVRPLIRREIASRYRGSVLGILWSLLTPMFMLAVYTFVFGVVLRARWDVPNRTGVEHSTAEFGVILFGGLLAFQFFSEVVGAAPGLVVGNRNYVKKIVFPIQILPVVSLGAALFHAAISLLVLLAFTWSVFGAVPWTAVLTPLVIAPLAVMALGIAWFLAAVGVYFRDVGQIVPPILTGMLFLSPVLFQRTAMPEQFQPYLSLNPLAIPVEALRDVALFGLQPDWMGLGYYSLAAIAVALFGERFFQLTRGGFADVL